MKIIRWILLILAVLVLLVVAAFFYYLYVPAIDPPELSGDYQSHSIKVDDIDRSFGFYLPKQLDVKPPLIFVLHGSNQPGDSMRKATGFEFETLADQYGFIVVYPDGYQKHWNDCRASADYQANQKNIDDPAFFTAMISYFSETHSVDSERIFATGLSNGGHMAYRLALELPDIFAAVAPMAANLPVDSNMDCQKSGRPISIAVFNGTEDPINPYQGGRVKVGSNDSRGDVLSSHDTIGYWLGLAQINNEPETRTHPEQDGDDSTSVREDRWLGNDGTQVRLYTLQGSGHVVPSRIVTFPRILGKGAGDISAPQEIVNFFLGVE
ncbi:MAG: PHB depolymerase family esterase [Pseudomonadales bacterium]